MICSRYVRLGKVRHYFDYYYYGAYTYGITIHTYLIEFTHYRIELR